MRAIELSNGFVTFIDDEDYQTLAEGGWYGKRFGVGKFYVVKKTSRKDHPDRKQRLRSLHRVLLGLDFGDRRVADHINGNTLDNRRSNLRIATQAQNSYNSKPSKLNKSGYKGVSWHKKSKKWVAAITQDGHTRHLGYFACREDAAKAYNKAAMRLRGAFAYLNTIEEKECWDV